MDFNKNDIPVNQFVTEKETSLLKNLSKIDEIFIYQKIDFIEIVTRFESNNKFTIKNSLGEKIFWAIEKNDCCTRNFCGSRRPTKIKIVDDTKNCVIKLKRPLRCKICCFPCCLQRMEVFSPPGILIGTIEQKWSIFKPKFLIKNSMGEIVFNIQGPVCKCGCGSVIFMVFDTQGNKIGKISKNWSGLVKELFTDADNFRIKFPIDLDVRMKAVLLGSCFLIDMMYFED